MKGSVRANALGDSSGNVVYQSAAHFSRLHNPIILTRVFSVDNNAASNARSSYHYGHRSYPKIKKNEPLGRC